MRLTYHSPPIAGDIFNLYVTDVAGAARIEWLIDDNIINITDCKASACDDRLYIRPQFVGKELCITGTDRVETTEIRVQIIGKGESGCAGVGSADAPRRFPAIRDVMHRAKRVRLKMSDDTEVTLHHTGTKYSPGPINVVINGRRKGTIGTDGYFSELPDIPLDDIIKAVLQEIDRNPRAAIEGSGRHTGVCAVCGRPLSNPESVARGIGPVCAGLAFR